MSRLLRGTRRADTAVEECVCYQDCTVEADSACAFAGQWHAHDDEACAKHPERLVARG